MKKLLYLSVLLCFMTGYAQDITGPWKGAVSIQGVKLNLVFKIEASPSGYSATMDSPDQGALGIPLTSVTFAQPVLTMSLPAGQIEYTGTLSQDKITGNFKQGANSWPLVLERGKFEQNRPQEPRGPFPYIDEEVVFKNTKENFDLAGTLTVPKTDGKSPAVILISGSGQQDRNSTIMGHKPFHVLADHLTRAGIAVLRYDDRGVGGSKGDPRTSTSADFAEDVRAAVQYLKTRKEIDLSKIGLIGHSEGGMIAPMVAAGSTDIAFIALLAGPGLPGDQLLLQQTEALAKAEGSSDGDISTMLSINKQIYDAVIKYDDASALNKALTQIFKTAMQTLPEAQQPSKEEQDALIKAQIAPVTVPWMRYFIRYNPAKALQRVKCPVLVMNGQNDLQVPAMLNTEAIKNLLDKGGNRNVQVEVLPGLNHLFQESITGKVEEYGEIEETFSPAALNILTSWITKQL